MATDTTHARRNHPVLGRGQGGGRHRRGAVRRGDARRGARRGPRAAHARPEFARVLLRCSFLVDGEPVGTRDHKTIQLAEGGTVEVLPPFAGG